jgi:hypothetical protein
MLPRMVRRNEDTHAEGVLSLGNRVCMLHELADLGFSGVSRDLGTVGHARGRCSFRPTTATSTYSTGVRRLVALR